MDLVDVVLVMSLTKITVFVIVVAVAASMKSFSSAQIVRIAVLITLERHAIAMVVTAVVSAERVSFAIH